VDDGDGESDGDVTGDARDLPSAGTSVGAAELGSGDAPGVPQLASRTMERRDASRIRAMSRHLP
jgi:hypothetical protein